MVVFLPFFVKISEKMNELERVSKDKLTLQEQKGELKYEKTTNVSKYAHDIMFKPNSFAC